MWGDGLLAHCQENTCSSAFSRSVHLCWQDHGSLRDGQQRGRIHAHTHTPTLFFPQYVAHPRGLASRPTECPVFGTARSVEALPMSLLAPESLTDHLLSRYLLHAQPGAYSFMCLISGRISIILTPILWMSKQRPREGKGLT